MPNIGFTHGSLYRAMDKFSPELFELLAKFGKQSIEISCMLANEVELLPSILPFIKGYVRKSIHFPTNVRYTNDEATRQMLSKISEFYQTINAELAVIHPDLIDDVSVFNDYPLAWAAENMDNRKPCFKSLDDMRKFFTDNPSWLMVLDVNHCFSNDTSMKLAYDLTTEFRDRIKEIHLSGYIDYHEPLFQTQQEEIMRACLDLDVPIIIESTFKDSEHTKQEFEYITNYFERHSLPPST